jgi:hypothetical protein
MSMNGPDLSKMSPNLTAFVIVCLIGAAVVLELSDSPNTLIIITALIGMIGLQQARTSQTANRIEHQTNGIMERRHAELQANMTEIKRLQAEQSQAIKVISSRLEDGDLKFEVMQAADSGARQAIADLQARLDELTSCKPQTDDEAIS